MDASENFESRSDFEEALENDAFGADGAFDCSQAWWPCHMCPYATAECFW